MPCSIKKLTEIYAFLCKRGNIWPHCHILHMSYKGKMKISSSRLSQNTAETTFQNQSIQKILLHDDLITFSMLVKGYCNTTFYFPIIYSSNSCHTIFRFCFFPARYDKKEIYCSPLRLVAVLQYVFRYLPFTFRPINTRLRLLQKSSLLLFPLIFFIIINIFSDVLIPGNQIVDSQVSKLF